jgi:hypothetical protein
MSHDDRRIGARFLTELNVVLSPSNGGPPIDDRATAHDVSIKGFKVESQAQLAEGAMVSFSLDLPMGECVSGTGRIVWSNRETFATWAGVEIVSMPWSDKRRLNKLLNPDTVNWERISNLLVTLVMVLTVLAAAHRIIYSAQLRGLVEALAPKIVALFVMGWALVGLLKRNTR